MRAPVWIDYGPGGTMRAGISWTRYALWLVLITGALIAQVTETGALPILEKKCFQCHGDALKMGNLDLRTRASMLKGGDKGPAIVAGNAEQSLLIHRVTGKVAPKMPMPPMPALTADEIAVLKDWIDQGAHWKDSAPAQTVAAGYGSGYKERAITSQDRQWWAFQKPVRRE